MSVSDYIREHYSERVMIPMRKIRLVEIVHKKGNYTVKGIPTDKLTMIVRDLHDGTYGLVTGWRAYQECRASDEGIAYCLVVKDNRLDFLGKYGETNKKIKNAGFYIRNAKNVTIEKSKVIWGRRCDAYSTELDCENCSDLQLIRNNF